MTRPATAPMLAPMPSPQRKPAPEQSSKGPRKPPKAWPDGRTANERLRTAFDEWRVGVPGRELAQEDLVRACNVVVGRAPDAEPPYVSQPLLSMLLTDQVDAAGSRFLDVIGEAMGFRSVWIRTGAGAPHIGAHSRELLRVLEERLRLLEQRAAL